MCVKPHLWSHFIRTLTPEQFKELCTQCAPKWVLPRNGGWRIQKRKHPIHATMFAVIGSLCTGNDDLTMEAICKMSHSLICKEMEHMLFVLDEVLDNMWLMSEEEKQQCIGACKSNPNIIYFLDGCDFAIEEQKNRWMYKTHKDNIKKQTAIRAQILVDTLWGYFRGMECGPAGVNNDQGMLKKSVWNQENVLTSGDESIGADGGYFTTEHISVTKPFTVPEIAGSEDYQLFNNLFNADREIIERSYCFLKNKFRAFSAPWRRSKQKFPVALRVALKLSNVQWMSEDGMHLGLKKQYDRIHTI